MSSAPVFNDLLVGGQYRLQSLIAKSSKSKVYVGTDAQCGHLVAVKTESGSARSLDSEFKAYTLLANSGVTPQPRWLGSLENSDDTSVLVTELLGPSIEDLFNFCSRKFSLKTVLQLADQMLGCLQVVHMRGLLHRDVKPDNFMIGLGAKANTVFIADFGLVGTWCDPKTKEHTSKGSGRPLIGTLRYMSVNAHWGIKQSRRDDLESLGYTFVYLLAGGLPWMQVRTNGRSQQALSDAVLRSKTSITVEDLCSGLPAEFAEYIRYCRRLRFDEEPDYEYLRQMFAGLLMREGQKSDHVFDWTLVASGSLARAAAATAAGCKEKKVDDSSTTARTDFEQRSTSAGSRSVAVPRPPA